MPSAGTQVGIADNTTFYVPVIETPEHIAAAKKATRVENAMFLTAIMEGRYIDEYLHSQGAAAPKVQAGDFKAIGSPLDFLALNIYAPEWVGPTMAPAAMPTSRTSPPRRGWPRPG